MLAGKNTRYASASLEAFGRLPREALADDAGLTYRELRRGLKPRYGLVWRDVALGYAALGLVAWLLARVDDWSLGAQLLAAAAGAVAIGYAVAFILLFFHEAAHYNVAPGRRLNDALANGLIGCLVGQDIRAYRRIHFDHHRHLGTTADTERTYFQPLNAWFLVQALTGVLAFRVLLGRERVLQEGEAPARRSGLNAQLVLGLVLHAAIVGAAIALGHWALAAAWVAGVGAVFPFFAAVRQALEHRDFGADPATNYADVHHGACVRVFGSGPIASTLGGAGFNRHLLHHWDPQVPCTRLAELEAFVLRSPAREHYEAQRATYAGTFGRLFVSDSRRKRRAP